jgi:hypothetical protein
VTLSESNVFLLDCAEYKLNDEAWLDRTKILRIDNIIRNRLHIPGKGTAWKQQWSIPESERAPITHVTTRFSFKSEFDIAEDSMLALEDAERIKIKVSDVNVPFSIEEQSGW